jgi:hypothetical protein
MSDNLARLSGTGSVPSESVSSSWFAGSNPVRGDFPGGDKKSDSTLVAGVAPHGPVAIDRGTGDADSTFVRPANTGSSSFAPRAPSAIHTLGDAVVNALAQRRLDEARLTNAERMEARMRGRVRVAGSASLGGGDGDGGRGDDTDTDTDTESESDVDGSGDGNGDGDGDGIGPKNGLGASPRKASRPPRSFFRAFLPGFSPTDRSPRSPRFPRGEEDGHRRRRRSSSHHQTGRKSRLHGKPSGRKSSWRRPARLLAKTKIRFRRFAARVVEHEDFEALVVLAIFVNCVSLALYRPLENTDPGD